MGTHTHIGKQLDCLTNFAEIGDWNELHRGILTMIIRLAVALLQLTMTQVVTFVLSLLLPGMGDFPQTYPALFVVILGITYSTGVFLPGWLALERRWLKARPDYSARLIATLVGAYVPLVVALMLYRSLEPGNPFFSVSILTCVLGFYIPGWIGRKQAISVVRLRNSLRGESDRDAIDSDA